MIDNNNSGYSINATIVKSRDTNYKSMPYIFNTETGKIENVDLLLNASAIYNRIYIEGEEEE